MALMLGVWDNNARRHSRMHEPNYGQRHIHPVNVLLRTTALHRLIYVDYPPVADAEVAILSQRYRNHFPPVKKERREAEKGWRYLRMRPTHLH